jgi:IS5 family transposase
MVGKKFDFSNYEQSIAKKNTKKEKFLAEMDQVVPWQPLLDLIVTVCPKVSSKGGHSP